MQSNHRSQHVRKKQREKILLTEFQALYVDFPPGILIETEEPDFLVRTGSHTLGIEVFEFHKKEPGASSSHLRERESFHERLVQRAQSLFEDKYPIPLQVIFHGHGSQRNAKLSEFESWGAEIADLVVQHIPQALHETTYLDREVLRHTLVHHVIHSFSVTKLGFNTPGLWTFAETSSPETSLAQLQSEISIKDAKIQRYQAQCSEVWLLIIIGGRSIATMVDLPKDLVSHAFHFRFDRVLVYNRMMKTVATLEKYI